MGYISMNAPADSFSFTFKNISNTKRSLELFQLGLSNIFTPVNTGIAEDIYPTRNSAWITAPNQYQAFSTFFEKNPLDLEDTSNTGCVWVAQSVITRLGISTTTGQTAYVDLPTTYTGDIDDINAEIQALVDSLISGGFLGAGMKCRMSFLPLFPSSTSWKTDCFGWVFWREGVSSSTKVTEFFIEQGGLKVLSFTGMEVWYSGNARQKYMANQVEVSSGGGIPYDEIERSQNGAFLDVRGVGVQVLSSSLSTIYTQNSQNLNSLGFLKLNPTGDDYIHYLNPTISPYQTQNVVNDIDMDDKSGLFVLDGNTRFDYDINAWTNVELTFDYVQFPNFILKYGWKVAEAIIDVRQGEQDIINKVNNIRDEVVLDVKEKDVDKVAKLLSYAKRGRK